MHTFYYDGYKTLSHNMLFNMVLSNRGAGKTFFFKEWAIKDFLKTGAQFVYLRRYKQEFKKIKTFWNDIAYMFPDHVLTVSGLEFLIDGKLAGYAIALSTSKIEKSTSYPMVNKILFDEFIIDRGVYHYLPDEVTCFLEFYETVARMRENVRVMFFANAITISNPYFMYFRIELPYNTSVVKRNDVLLEIVENDEFTKAKKQTRFGKLISGTEYSDYAIDNKFLRDNGSFIERKSEKANYYFTFKYMGVLYGVWVDYSMGRFWVSDNVDPSCKIVYSITLDDHTNNTMLIRRLGSAIMFKSFIENYKIGNVYFENMKIKGVTYDVIRLMVVA